MLYVAPATRDDVVFHWLKSEWWKLPFTPPPGSFTLVDAVDLSDPAQNRARSQLLQYRGPVVNPLPSGATYSYVQIEERDLASLYFIAVWDWFLDTGRTFELANTLTHLAHGRGGVVNGRRQEVDHLDAVEKKIAYLEAHPDDRSDEFLILVATDTTGPYTIIDGTHRAAALLRLHRTSSTTPWNAILVESGRMTGYQWHVGFARHSELVIFFAELAERGDIW